MGFELKKESYSGCIKEISIGKGDCTISVGGETCYPFYTFEGDMPNKPIIAMEIWDIEPEDWAEPVMAHFKDVFSDPAAWAKKCVDDFAADAIVIQLKSIDPNDKDASPESAAETIKKVLAAVKVPCIVWGCANPDKDEEVLKVIAERCQGENLVVGPVDEKNYKGIGAAAMGYGHTIIASSPIDVNLAKQVNILLENLGMPMDKLLVDPTTGGLGYGMEYSYSVMERLVMAAMVQGDDKLQFPMINNLGNEIWKCKEAKQTLDEAPLLGDPEKRGVMMEAIGAISYLLSGSNIIIMRHPEAIRMTKEFIDALIDGGSLTDAAAIAKILDDANIDFAALAPAPDLSIAEEKKKPAPVKVAAAPATTKTAKPADKPVTSSAPAKQETKAPDIPEPKSDSKGQDEAKAATETKLAIEAKKEQEVEAKAKQEAAARAQKDRAKAEEEAKAKDEAEINALRLEKQAREDEEEYLKKIRAKARKDAAKATTAHPVAEVAMTAAKDQKTEQENIVAMLDRLHKRK